MNWLYSLFVLAQTEMAPAAPAAAPAAGAPPGAEAAPAAGPCGGPQAMIQLVMIVAIFVIFYFILIRPQQKRARQHQDMLKALQKGDSVYTQGGIYGKVVTLTDNTVTLEIARVDNKEVRIRVLRSAVSGKATPPTEGGEAKDAEAIAKTTKE